MPTDNLPDHPTSRPEQVGCRGAIRPDHGPDQYDLRCVTCGATWVGPDLDPCWWCQRRHENLIDGQHTLALMEPDYDPDEQDDELINRVNAWSQRLAIAIEAGLVTGREADQAVEAWVRKVEAWRSNM